MNRYLVFWDMIGIWPTYYFLADSRGVGRRVFEASINLIRDQRPDASPILLLESDFEAAVPGDLPAVFFRRDDRNGNQHEFAETLNDPMYFHRGSLTSLLNLISVLRIAPLIRLVGVDLNRPGTFFESTRNETGGDKYFNPWDEYAKDQGVHATVANMEKAGWGSGTMLDEFHTLVAYLADRGITITSASRDSLLVEEGLCAFEALVATEAERDSAGIHRHSGGISP